jgi:hypothetical protein
MPVAAMACDRESRTLTGHAMKSDAARVPASAFLRARVHPPCRNLEVFGLQLRWWVRGAGSRFPWSESAERISMGASGLIPGQGGTTKEAHQDRDEGRDELPNGRDHQ